MRYLRDDLHWHFRIRVKSSTWIYRPRRGWKQLKHYHLALAEVVLLQGVTLTKTHALEGVHLALARDALSRQLWMVVSDQPTSLQTFREYSERFQIEEEFLDEKSNGFQLERSQLRSTECTFTPLSGHGSGNTAADGARTTGGRNRQTSLGGFTLATRQ